MLSAPKLIFFLEMPPPPHFSSQHHPCGSSCFCSFFKQTTKQNTHFIPKPLFFPPLQTLQTSRTGEPPLAASLLVSPSPKNDGSSAKSLLAHRSSAPCCQNHFLFEQLHGSDAGQLSPERRRDGKGMKLSCFFGLFFFF